MRLLEPMIVMLLLLLLLPPALHLPSTDGVDVLPFILLCALLK
jgi:hypothetical protein